MKFRALLLTVLVMLMVIMPAAISAQEINTCFNLSEEDCAELDAATLNLAGFAMTSESFSIEYALDFSATGLPAEELGSDSVAFNSSGAIDIVMGGEGTIPVTIGAVFDSAYGMGDMMTEMPIEVRLVDDFLYFLDPMSGVWQQIDLVAEMSDPEFSEQLDDIMGGGDDETGGMMPDIASLMALTTVLDLPGLIDYTRDGDDFIFTMDLTVLGVLAEPEYADKLATLVEVLNETSEGSGDQFAGVVQMIPTMLEEGTIVIVQSINSELEIVDYIGFDVALTLNAAAFTGSPDPITVGLTFEMEVTNIDSAPAAVAPDEFEEFDPSTLFGGM